MSEPTRILIIEDLATDAELASREIRKALPNCTFQRVETEDTFLQALAAYQPDLILSDYHLPHFTGLQALKLTLAQAPLTPLIIYTGSLNEDVAVECMKAGATNYVIKENLKRLGTAVVHALNEKQVRIERLRAEKQLTQANKRYQELFENAGPNIVIVDGAGQYLMVNNHAAANFGVPPDAVIGKTMFDFLPLETAQKYLALNQQLLKSGGRREYEDTFLMAAGQRVFLVVDQCLTDAQGQNIAIQSSSIDITERKQTEIALLDSEKRFRSLVEESRDGVILINEQGLIIEWNEAQAQITGIPRSRALGAPVWEIQYQITLPEHQANLNLEYLKTAFLQTLEVPAANHVGQLQEIQIQAASGELKYLQQTAFLIKHENHHRLGAIVRDVTDRKQAELEFSRLTMEKDLILSSAAEGIIGLDLEGRHKFVNPAAAKLLGYEVAELIGQPSHEIWHHSHSDGRPYPLAECKIYAAYQDGSVHQASNEVFWRKDGRSFPVEYASTPIFEGSRLVGAVVTFADISARRQSEAALRASEEKHRTVVNQAAEGIAIAQDAVIKFANSSFATMVGAELNEIEGHEFTQLIPPENLALILERYEKRLAGETVPRTYESVLLHKDGTRLPVEINAAAIQYEGRAADLVIVRNISERKRAEERIERQLQRLNALHAVDQAIRSSFDLHSTLQVVLQQVLTHLGVDAAAILMLNPTTQLLEHAASRGFHSEVLNFTQLRFKEGYAGQAISTRQRIHISDVLNSGGKLAEALRTAQESFFEYFGVPLIAKNEVKGVLEIYQRSALQPDPDWLAFMETLADQTAIAIDNAQLFDNLQRMNAELEQRVIQRTAELNHTNLQLEHANRAKDEFLANMSHELRTPLNSILGLSETLLEQRRAALSEHQQKSLRTIAASGTHLLSLINDILDLSKIEAGKFDYYPQIVEVDEICRSSLSFVKESAVRKAINLIYRDTEAVPKMYADSRRLKQILVNLLTNAVKFTGAQGEVILQVVAKTALDQIQFSVIDTGIGIAPPDLSKLFQPFVQVDSSLTREYEGTGLGLALVQKLTDLHGGSVTVESEVGRGSHFMVTLPLGLAMLGQQPHEQTPAASLPASAGADRAHETITRGLILLAEDNMANVLMVGDYLESYGYQLAVAHDGLEALEIAQRLHPDLILMDIQMPALDGLEAIRRLRQDANFKSTPIIALTALAMPGDRERCLAAGANEYMSKPVSLKALGIFIKQLLRG